MRYKPSDFEWTAIKPMLPNCLAAFGVDDRGVLNGIFWVLGYGALWPDLQRSMVLVLLVTVARPVAAAGVRDQIVDALAAAHDGRCR